MCVIPSLLARTLVAGPIALQGFASCPVGGHQWRSDDVTAEQQSDGRASAHALVNLPFKALAVFLNRILCQEKSGEKLETSENKANNFDR